MSHDVAAVPEFVRDWARTIEKMKLVTPALMLLEAHKPLGFVTSQFVMLGQPMIDLMIPTHHTQNFISLLSNRHHVDGLIRELERR